VLVEVPKAERDRRLADREEASFLAAWHVRWDSAEDHYFTTARSQESFDLVVPTGEDGSM
jgi:hypothetical protein